MVACMEPVLYAQSASGSIAYQVLGGGSFDLVCVPGLVNHIETAWDEPAMARHYRRLAAFCRLVVMDRRGASRRDSPSGWIQNRRVADDVTLSVVGSTPSPSAGGSPAVRSGRPAR